MVETSRKKARDPGSIQISVGPGAPLLRPWPSSVEPLDGNPKKATSYASELTTDCRSSCHVSVLIERTSPLPETINREESGVRAPRPTPSCLRRR
jgi:hypothetical protein